MFYSTFHVRMTASKYFAAFYVLVILYTSVTAEIRQFLDE